jgi:hypothetical protein
VKAEIGFREPRASRNGAGRVGRIVEQKHEPFTAVVDDDQMLGIDCGQEWVLPQSLRKK